MPGSAARMNIGLAVVTAAAIACAARRGTRCRPQASQSSRAPAGEPPPMPSSMAVTIAFLPPAFADRRDTSSMLSVRNGKSAGITLPAQASAA